MLVRRSFRGHAGEKVVRALERGLQPWPVRGLQVCCSRSLRHGLKGVCARRRASGVEESQLEPELVTPVRLDRPGASELLRDEMAARAGRQTSPDDSAQIIAGATSEVVMAKAAQAHGACIDGVHDIGHRDQITRIAGARL
jgi:hypothetical protein